MVRVETDEETNDLKTDNLWPDMWKHMSDASKRKAKRKRIIEKPKLDNARRLRGIFFIEPDAEEFKHTMKTARRKLEIPMPAAMPGKTPIDGRGETCRSIGKHKNKFACIVEADETMRIQLEGVPCRHSEDHIAAKGIKSLSTTIWHTNSFQCLKRSKYRMQRLQWRKNGKMENISAWQLTKVRNKKEDSLKQGIKAEKFILRH